MKLLATFVIFAVMAMLEGCGPKTMKELISNVDKDCVIHGNFSASTGVPATVTLAGTIDCSPNAAGLTPKPAAQVQ